LEDLWCQKVVKKLSKRLSKSFQKVVKSCQKSCQKVVKKLKKKLSKSCQKVVKKCQKIVKKLSKCYLVKICNNCIPIKSGWWLGGWAKSDSKAFGRLLCSLSEANNGVKRQEIKETCQ
jgi:hypothetical protein